MNKWMDSFEQKKQYLLKQIAETSSENPDASPKGIIDVLVLPLIHKINSDANMVTTSSCSGRVSVFLEGQKHENKPGAKGEGGKWLYIEHDPSKLAGLREWWHQFKSNSSGASYQSDGRQSDGLDLPLNTSSRLVLYKFEPVILHVKCRDFESAAKLYTLAMGCGFRESGIGSNYSVGIRTSMRLDLPVGILHENGHTQCLVDSEYMENVLIPMTEDMFRKNGQKTRDLENAVKEELKGHNLAETDRTETKQERRERKQREGLERQRMMKQKDNGEPPEVDGSQ